MANDPHAPDSMARITPSQTHAARIRIAPLRFGFLVFTTIMLLGGLSAMGWLKGLTQNWAFLEPDAADPALRSPIFDLPPDQAMAHVASVAATLPRWAVVHQDPAAGSLHLTFTTPICRFVDDIRLQFEPRDHGQRSIMRGESRSRIGKGDLGQNARNLTMLIDALNRHRSMVTEHSSPPR